MLLSHLFSTEELEALDQKQLDILNDLLLHEVRTSPEIRNLLHSKLRPVYTRWTGSRRRSPPAPGRGRRSPPAAGRGKRK